MKEIILLILIYLCFSSCMTVVPFQKIYLNNEDMQLETKIIEEHTNSFQAYREGASGANTGNIGGGCGCN